MPGSSLYILSILNLNLLAACEGEVFPVFHKTTRPIITGSLPVVPAATGSNSTQNKENFGLFKVRCSFKCK